MVRGVVGISFLAIPFIAAGRVDGTRGWILPGVVLVMLAIHLTLMVLKNPGRLRERLKKQKLMRTFDSTERKVALQLCGTLLRQGRAADLENKSALASLAQD